MNLVSVTRSSLNPQGTMVLMHGLGSDEQDMFGLAQQIDERVEVICLRAPFSYGPGYAWFDINWTQVGIQVDPKQVQESVVAVAQIIESLQCSPLIVGGFSQGAMMALGILHQIPRAIRGAMLLSGRDVDKGCPEFDGQVFQAHGSFDDVISIREAHSLRETLTELGGQYQFHEYQMGHSICEQELIDINAWLANALDLK